MRECGAGGGDSIETGAGRNTHMPGAQECVNQLGHAAEMGWNASCVKPRCVIAAVVMLRIEARRNDEGGRQVGLIRLAQGFGICRAVAAIDLTVLENVRG